MVFLPKHMVATVQFFKFFLSNLSRQCLKVTSSRQRGLLLCPRQPNLLLEKGTRFQLLTRTTGLFSCQCLKAASSQQRGASPLPTTALPSIKKGARLQLLTRTSGLFQCQCLKAASSQQGGPLLCSRQPRFLSKIGKYLCLRQPHLL